MADSDFPNKISDPLNNTVQGVNPIDNNTPSQTGKQAFAEHMQETPAKGPQGPTPMQALTPPTNLTGTPSVNSVNDQLRATSSQLGDLNSKLHTPNLKLKPSQKFLVRSKLEDAHKNIRDSAEKLGVNVGNPPDLKNQPNPIAKFLALIEDGQMQMQSAQEIITKNAESGVQMSPEDLLLAQVKLNRAQQQIDFSSVVLSKAIDDLKTLFNVQI